MAIFTWPINAIVSKLFFRFEISPIRTNTTSNNSTSAFLQKITTDINAANQQQSNNNTEPAEPAILASNQSRTFISSQNIEVHDFSIEIPSIDLNHPIQAKVNPADPKEYLPVLDESVAHGKNTALPGQYEGNVYLFAHSKDVYTGETPDGGWFTRIDELDKGEMIMLHFNGKIYTYEVIRSFVISPKTTNVYTRYSNYEDTNSLTLQTCYPRGDTDNRLIVVAVEVS